MECVGLFSTGVSLHLKNEKDIGRFSGEDKSDDDARCHCWTSADKKLILLMLRFYEQELKLPRMEFLGLDHVMAQTQGQTLSPDVQRYLFGCVVYQQLKDVESLLFVYD
jgi:hypothetical protein